MSEIEMNRPDRSFSKRDIYYLFFKHRRYLILFVGFVLLAALAYVYITSPSYRAAGKILVAFSDQSNQSAISKIEIPSYDMIVTMKHSEIIASEIEILRSRQVAERVFRKLGPDVLQSELDQPRNFWQKVIRFPRLAWRKMTIGLNKILVFLKLQEAVSRDDAILLQLSKRMKAEIIRESNSIEISFTAKSPQLAARCANEFIEQYMLYRLDIHQAVNTVDFLNSKTQAFYRQLALADENLRKFKERWQIASLDDQTKYLLRLQSDIQSEKNKTETELARLTGRVTEINLLLGNNSGQMGNETISQGSRVIDDLKLKHLDLKLKRIDMALKYPEGSPMLQALASELQDVEKKLQLEKAEKAFSVDIASMEAKKVRLGKMLVQASAEVQQVGKLSEQLRELQRQVEINEKLYKEYFEKTEEAGVIAAKEAANISNVKILEAAVPPILAIRTISFIPQRIFVLLLTGMLGVLIGVIFIAIREIMDHSFKSADDLENALSVPVLTTIPNVVDAGPDQAAEHEFTLLKNNLLLAGLQDQSSILLFTSSSAGEGVSFVCRQLAKMLSASGPGKILLLDLNIRSQSFSFKSAAPGLSDHLLAKAALNEVIQSGDNGNLFRLDPGQIEFNPAHLLSSRIFAEKLAKLRQQFQVVIIDTPPLQPYPDALTLAGLADGIILVVRAESTRREIVANSVKKLSAIGAKMLGVVLNRRRHYIPSQTYRKL